MSEQPQLPLTRQRSAKDTADSPVESMLNKALKSQSYVQEYVDLDSDSSGIFSSLDIEAAKQFIKQSQE